jgi:hypothetical protein
MPTISRSSSKGRGPRTPTIACVIRRTKPMYTILMYIITMYDFALIEFNDHTFSMNSPVTFNAFLTNGPVAFVGDKRPAQMRRVPARRD